MLRHYTYHSFNNVDFFVVDSNSKVYNLWQFLDSVGNSKLDA